ncbi:MAG TPA: sugar transferase [Planctomycetota bacterium]|nr:sugar transferase [Planctomycetota bacterium]
MLKRLHRIDHAALFLNVFQLLIDAVACLAGFAIAYWAYNHASLLDPVKTRNFAPSIEVYYTPALAFTALVLLTFAVKHLYQSRETGLMNMDEASSVLHGLFVACSIMAAGSYFLINQKTTEIARLIVGMGAFFGSVFVLGGRALGYKVRRYLQMRGHFFRRVIICGVGDAGRTIARKCLHSPKFHVLPVAFLDDDAAVQDTRVDCLIGHDPIPVAGALSRVEETLDEFRADEIWIALPDAKQDTIRAIADAAGDAEVPCRFVPNLYQIPLQTVTVDSLAGMPLLSIKPRPKVRPMPITKRVFDVVFSLLVFTTLPVWPLIALLIKATSNGPVFFKQKRIGQAGKAFTMYKFRTMFAEAPQYATTPQTPADARITPVGRWLRRLSIDELPQFWNVLRGDMSVVGPRPEMPQIVERYTAMQRERLAVKPGITGVWQISADRRNPIHENIDYDLYYIEKQSFFLDLMIILTTGVYGARGV